MPAKQDDPKTAALETAVELYAGMCAIFEKPRSYREDAGARNECRSMFAAAILRAKREEVERMLEQQCTPLARLVIHVLGHSRLDDLRAAELEARNG